MKARINQWKLGLDRYNLKFIVENLFFNSTFGHVTKFVINDSNIIYCQDTDL